MPTSIAHHSIDELHADTQHRDVVVACPDARPPAYQAVVGLENECRLDRFVTGFYHRRADSKRSWLRQIAPNAHAALDRKLARRRIHSVSPSRVISHVGFDISLAIENRVSGAFRQALARHRTERFDRALVTALQRREPASLLAFSDVASGDSLEYCKANGIRTVLSMVHGEVYEELEVLSRERQRSPEFFEIYLGDGRIDWRELDWLHARRLRDLELADVILVPSEHIQERLRQHGINSDRIKVIPYAADTRRFTPLKDKRHGSNCRFLFAGGITQRKGIKDLLEAWRIARRSGWTLQLLGAMPRNTRPLEPYRSDFEWLGRVGHSEMPAVMAQADVFVFPSLFEGSAVVTYEALACGLPSIVTRESGSVARHGLDGLLVPAADPTALAQAMIRLGDDPALRESMSISARKWAREFDWPRYHRSLLAAIDNVSLTQPEESSWT